MTRVSVVGAGNVGATVAFSLILEKVCSEILLVDIDQAKCEAQVLDIQDVAFMRDIKVSVGSFQEAGQSDIIVITAGVPQKPGEPRTALIDRNYQILSSIINQMKPFKENTILMLVANPVDILTYIAQQISGLPKNQVIGSGTYLDSSRLKGYLSATLGVARSSVHAYVLGEHGDSQFVAWSSAHIANVPLKDFPGSDKLDYETISKDTATKAYKIIQGKGSTYYGIGGCAALLCDSLLQNTNQVRPVSHYIEKYGVCISIPAVIGSRGIVQTVPVSFSPEEEAKLDTSVTALRNILHKYTFEKANM